MNNTAIFTTKYLLEGKQDIVYVVHDSDGSWQFLSDHQITTADARLVAMDEILE